MDGEGLPDPVTQDLLGAKGLSALTKLLERLMGPRDFKPLGAGASSVVLDVGRGQALRLGLGDLAPIAPVREVVQPLLRVCMGGLRAEVVPKADTAGITEADVLAMSSLLAAEGYEFSDAGTDNLGRVCGRLLVIDPGAVQAMNRPASG